MYQDLVLWCLKGLLWDFEVFDFFFGTTFLPAISVFLRFLEVVVDPSSSPSVSSSEEEGN
jgi:hypothetical protein